MTVLSGLDRIARGELEAVNRVRGRRIGLVAHPASVDRQIRHARSILEGVGARVVALFGPEHGIGGEAQDMVGVAADDIVDGARLYSLYGASEADLRPKAEMLEGVDAVVVDLQDVGARYYTFVWTAALVLEVAAGLGIETIILDRPNPIGGDVVEGAPQRPGYRSFVGLYDVPVRHGLTIGEIGHLVARELGLGEGALTVVSMTGYSRAMRWEATGLPWILPSPNMPTTDTATVYPGGCLIEGTTLSEGRGTTRPFEIWGAPWLDGARLAREVTISGAELRPLVFRPTFQKHAGSNCGGVQVHVVEERCFRPYETYLRLLAAALLQQPDEPAWRTEAYEYVVDRPAIDLLTGGPEFRETVDRARRGGALELEAVLERDRALSAEFMDASREHRLYR